MRAANVCCAGAHRYCWWISRLMLHNLIKKVLLRSIKAIAEIILLFLTVVIFKENCHMYFLIMIIHCQFFLEPWPRNWPGIHVLGTSPSTIWQNKCNEIICQLLWEPPKELQWVMATALLFQYYTLVYIDS